MFDSGGGDWGGSGDEPEDEPLRPDHTLGAILKDVAKNPWIYDVKSRLLEKVITTEQVMWLVDKGYMIYERERNRGAPALLTDDFAAQFVYFTAPDTEEETTVNIGMHIVPSKSGDKGIISLEGVTNTLSIAIANKLGVEIQQPHRGRQ